MDIRQIFDFQNNPTTSILVLVICVLYLITSGISLIFGINYVSVLSIFGSESIGKVLSGQVWTIITSVFLHANLFHIFFNALALWYLGRFLENFYGSKNLFSIFLLSAICGSILTIIWPLFFGFITGEIPAGINVSSVGASGGIFGMLGLIVHNKFLKSSYSFDLPVDESWLLSIIGINLLFGFFSGLPISNSAHIGGLIGGILLGYLFTPNEFAHTGNIKNKINNIIFYFLIFVTLLSFLVNFIFIFLL
jgi:rhomboid protease GluP